MPAAVETMVSVVSNEASQAAKDRTVPWHGLGVQVPEVLDDAQVLTLAGLDWRVSLRDTFYLNTQTGQFEPVDKAKAVVRDTDERVLGRVGDLYVPIQNDEMIEFGSALVDTTKAKWDTAGSLKGGAITFASFRMDDIEGIKIGGQASEELRSYLLVTNAHDGSRAFKAAVVPIRVVCMNTLQAALGRQQSSWSIKHTKNSTTRVDEARRALDLTVDYVEEFKAIAERLADVDHTVEEIESFIEEWVPLPEKRGVDAALANREALLGNILGSPTIPADLRKTSWGVFNGLTEWAEWERDQRSDKRTPAPERRMVSTLLAGPVAQIRDRAWRDLTAAVR